MEVNATVMAHPWGSLPAGTCTSLFAYMDFGHVKGVGP